MSSTTIRPRDRDALLGALRAGVVPRTGLQHVQVGRAREVAEILRDIERIRDGGASMRLVIGDYGSGKSFFLSMARAVAMQAGLVCMTADLSPDRRLHASSGQARALAADLVRSMSTRTKPDGGALRSVVERFLSENVSERMEALREAPRGHELVAVIQAFAGAADGDSGAGEEAALRWLRAEWGTRTEAREALGIRGIVDDTDLLDHMQGLGLLCRLAGYGGLMICVDECVNLCRLQSAQARSANYEQVLRIINASLGGGTGGIGWMLGGTPEFLADPRRGLWSYEALRSRLAENTFAREGLVDLGGPVIRLPSLTTEEFWVLLGRLRDLFPALDLPDEALQAFMSRAASRLGDSAFRTPRLVIKSFLDLLAVLESNPGTEWQPLLAKAELQRDVPPGADEQPLTAAEEDDEAAVGANDEEDGGNGEAGSAVKNKNAASDSDPHGLAFFRV